MWLIKKEIDNYIKSKPNLKSFEKGIEFLKHEEFIKNLKEVNHG